MCRELRVEGCSLYCLGHNSTEGDVIHNAKGCIYERDVTVLW